MNEDNQHILKKQTQDVEVVQKLVDEGIFMSEKAKDILNNSTHLKEMGLIIFMDRYAVKSKRDEFEKGDLVVAVSKDHPKYPKKDLGIIVEDKDGKLFLRMVTGVYADEKDLLSVSKLKCDKPLESIYDAYQRVSRAVASVEKGEKKEQYQEEFAEMLLGGYVQPAGRIMAGASVNEEGEYTSNLTLYNCYVIPSPGDSRKSIVRDSLFQMIEIMSRGGGVGMNLSTLRPRYAYVHGVNGKSSGSVSWGNLYSNATGLIEQGGSRRGALMLMMNDWHPDVEEFIASKHQIGFLDNANISVFISNEFMDAVKNDTDWHLEFPDIEDKVITKPLYDEYWDGNLLRWKKNGYKTKIFKTVRARDMWEKLIQSSWKSAEPGIVFSGKYNDLSNSYYYNDIVCTNPCGEQGLPPWGVCNLGHLALNNFIIKTGQDEIGPLFDFDWETLKKATRTLVRFLDNVIDLTPYIFEENKTNQLAERRVGAGTLGLAEVLIRMRLPFGSDEGNVFVDKLYEMITTTAYDQSIELAKEKGAFKYFKPELLESGFIKTLPLALQEKIREFGIRNVTLTTQAPTGTVGSMLGTSTGIEPFFAFKYYQQSRLGFHEVDIDVVGEYAKQADGSLQPFFVSAMDLAPEHHVRIQAVIQRWTDSSISKTANVPASFTVEDTMKLYEYAYDLGCKGMTIYRDGSRDEQVLSTNVDTGKKNLEIKGNQAVPNSEDSEVLIKSKPSAEEIIIVEPEVIEKIAEDSKQPEYGSEVGNTCPMCQKGIMVKLGGCTECSAGCGFKGGCDMR